MAVASTSTMKSGDIEVTLLDLSGEVTHADRLAVGCAVCGSGEPHGTGPV
jgi:hypothetical protein